MRKTLFVLLLVLLLGVCAGAFADADYTLTPLPAQITLKDKYTVLTRDNIDEHVDLLNKLSMSKSALLEDWDARGVVLQAWSPLKAKYSCLEISVTQDEDSAAYSDLMRHGDLNDKWKEYLAAFSKSEEYSALGNTVFEKAEKAHAKSNYYALAKYKRSSPSGDYRGYLAKTVYNGYTLIFDMRVYNRLTVDQDKNDIYYIIDTFAEIPDATPAPAPADGSGGDGTTGEDAGGPTVVAEVPLTITKAPPKETNTNTFTVEGTTAPAHHVIGVLMRIGSGDPIRFETDAHARNGSFKLKVTIPEAEETTWLMTLNVLDGDTVVADHVFDVMEYKKTLIPVTLDADVPSEVFGDELVIAGTTMKGVQVQCLVTSSGATWEKTVTPNGTGRFTFKVPVKEEGEYNIALAFTKRGYDSRRLPADRPTYSVSKYLTEDARKAQIKKNAQRVAYGTVSARIDQYVGKTLMFNIWVTGIEQIGDEWLISAAGSKVGENYAQKMVFMTEQEPAFSVGDKLAFYGKCIGPYQVQSEESTESVPSFDLLVWNE